MSSQAQPGHGTTRDPTFRNLSAQQAAGYAAGRKGYPPALIKFIVDHHRTTGGKTEVLLDVGCGPGNSTRSFAPHFDYVFGADPGEAMLETAKAKGGTSATGTPIRYQLCAAEELDTLPEPGHGSVDMINATAAAHWFDMPRFWAAAAKLLKPGGTIYLWTIIPTYISATHPNAEKLQSAMDNWRASMRPYSTPGNELSQNGYEGINMPWDQPETASLFEKDSFFRQRWDPREITDEDGDEEVFTGYAQTEWPLKDVKAMLGTISTVLRWQEAHPHLVGTDQDCVETAMAQIREAIGTSKEMDETVKIPGGMAAVVLCVKRAG